MITVKDAFLKAKEKYKHINDLDIKELLKFDDLADKNMLLTLSGRDGSKLTEIKYNEN